MIFAIWMAVHFTGLVAICAWDPCHLAAKKAAARTKEDAR